MPVMNRKFNEIFHKRPMMEPMSMLTKSTIEGGPA